MWAYDSIREAEQLLFLLLPLLEMSLDQSLEFRQVLLHALAVNVLSFVVSGEILETWTNDLPRRCESLQNLHQNPLFLPLGFSVPTDWTQTLVWGGRIIEALSPQCSRHSELTFLLQNVQVFTLTWASPPLRTHGKESWDSQSASGERLSLLPQITRLTSVIVLQTVCWKTDTGWGRGQLEWRAETKLVHGGLNQI